MIHRLRLSHANTTSFLTTLVLLLIAVSPRAVASDLVITGVLDGPLSGGIPKAIEVHALSNIPDLSIYGLGSANNGGGTDGQEFTFPAVGAAAGDFIYVASESPGFNAFFGFDPDFTSGAASINGDDAIELFQNGAVVDVFGDINVDGTGQAWEYLDGWAYRVNGSGPDGTTFLIANWSFSGPNALDGATTNASAATPFPLGSYVGGVGGENAPIVVSTTPGNGSGGVALDASINVNFSEDVNLTADAFTISCTLSGSLTFAVSGGPRAYTVDPDTDFVNSESCTVTVVASEVSDVDSDDPPDNMEADFVFSFDTATPPTPVSVVINEIMQNPSAVSDGNGEWFELFNATSEAIDIDGWTLQDNGSNLAVISNGGPLVISAGGFLVLGNNADTGTNGGVAVDYEYSGYFLANGDDEIILLDGLLTEVDRVEWDGGPNFPDPTGASMSLIDTALDNNAGANWCTAASPYGAGDLGTPGQVNDCGFRPVINEIDYDQPGSDTAEFIEIKNRGTEPGDLSGVTLLLVNGNGGTPYNAIDLPATVLGSGEYFVICKDAATVAICDFEALASVQNGAPDAVALSIEGVIVDTVSYEGDTAAPYTEGSGAGLVDSGSFGQDFKGISRLPDGRDTNRNNLDLAASCVTPGLANTSIANGCTFEGPVLEIYDIQGAGEASPYAGETLGSNNNVVTAVGVDGFAMQTPAGRSDMDSNTSDGIFVFTGFAPGVSVGDLVDVRGQVQEFFGFTEFGFGSTVTPVGFETPPPPVQLNANVPSSDPAAPSCAIEFECYEGMLVEITAGTVTGPNQRFNVDPVAEVFITAAAQRTLREPGIEFPGAPGLPVWDGNPEVFELDPDALGLDNQIIPAGSSFSATGIIAFEFGGYELWPSELNVSPAPLPVPVRAREPGEFSVGTLNMFRLFDDVDDPVDPNGRNDAVVSTAEYQRRLAKFSAHIRTVLDSPDILAVQEVEKLGVLEDLANLIALEDSSVSYTAYLEEGNDLGTIDVGFLVRDNITVNAVSQLGKDEVFVNPITLENNILHDRPPLLLEGHCELDFGTFPIAVMAVHNRSLGGIDGNEGLRVRVKRLLQAESIAAKVQDLQMADANVRLVVTGDFNAFEFTDGYADTVGVIAGDFNPLTSLVCSESVCAGDLVEPNLDNQTLWVPDYDRYSFIFRGNAQVLDHALTSQKLASEISGVEFGRGNADAAVDLINDAGSVLRSSDHDGLVVYIAKDADADGVPNDDDFCPNTTLPENVPTLRLGTNRFADIDGDGLFDTASPNGKGPRKAFDLGDTAGCSCEQIIEAQGLGNGHTKFGCSIGAMENWISLVSP
jgi:predicted extracellular nuclease